MRVIGKNSSLRDLNEKYVIPIKFMPYEEINQHTNIENESLNPRKSCKCSDYALNNPIKTYNFGKIYDLPTRIEWESNLSSIHDSRKSNLKRNLSNKSVKFMDDFEYSTINKNYKLDDTYLFKNELSKSNYDSEKNVSYYLLFNSESKSLGI